MPATIGVVDNEAEMLRIESMLGSADDARTVLRRFMGPSGTIPDDDASEVCATLRSCVGRLLRSEAEHDVLVRWHALLKAIAANLRERASGPRHETVVTTLAELVHERAGMARDADGLLTSVISVGTIVDAVRAAGTTGCPMRTLPTSTGWSEERIARVVVAAGDAGLLEVVRRGSETMLRMRPG